MCGVLINPDQRTGSMIFGVSVAAELLTVGSHVEGCAQHHARPGGVHDGGMRRL